MNEVSMNIPTEGEKAILKRLARKPIALRYGVRGWVPDSLPKGAVRADFDAVIKRGKAKIELATLVLVEQSTDSK